VALSRQIGLRGRRTVTDPGCMIFGTASRWKALLRWYRQGADVERHLPELSTYLGHVKVADTTGISRLPGTAPTGPGPPRAQSAAAGGGVVSANTAFPCFSRASSPTGWYSRNTPAPTPSPATGHLLPAAALCRATTQQSPVTARAGRSRRILDRCLSRHVEERRGCSARSRNVRLAAIHSFFRYAALQAPDHSGLIEQVLAIPAKRYERTPIAYLTAPESAALLAAPDLPPGWGGATAPYWWWRCRRACGSPS